jgi:hypothetical protein
MIKVGDEIPNRRVALEVERPHRWSLSVRDLGAANNDVAC